MKGREEESFLHGWLPRSLKVKWVVTSAEMGAYRWGQMERCERADTEMEEGRMQGGARDP